MIYLLWRVSCLCFDDEVVLSTGLNMLYYTFCHILRPMPVNPCTRNEKKKYYQCAILLRICFYSNVSVRSVGSLWYCIFRETKKGPPHFYTFQGKFQPEHVYYKEINIKTECTFYTESVYKRLSLKILSPFPIWLF